MTPHHLDSVYYRVTDLVPAFAGKRVFIAGNGFYASAFAAFFAHLKAKGIPVECVSFSRRDNWHIEDVEGYGAANLSADFVINACGTSSDHPVEQLYTNGLGPISLFHCMRLDARGLQISTGAINAQTPYARAKRVAETGIGLLNRGLGVQIVRPFATVGPGMNLDAHFAVSTFIKRHLAGAHLEVTSKPCWRSFAHIADLLVQMLHVLVSGDGQPYDVGSDNVVSMFEAASAVSDDVRLVDTTFATHSGAEFYTPDLRRVEEQFNLSLDYDSEEAVRDTLHWFQSRVGA